MDRSREIKKGVMAETLDELIERGEIFKSGVERWKVQIVTKFYSLLLEIIT